MIYLSSSAEFLTALSRAKNIALTAYCLPAGRVLDGLVAAENRGAHVRVRLEGWIYDDSGTVSAENAAAIEALRRAGADAKLVHDAEQDAQPLLHLKSAIVDGELYLDDRNWPDDGADTIVRDTFAGDARAVRDAVDGSIGARTPEFSPLKREALWLESGLFSGAKTGNDVIVESESFGANNRAFERLESAVKAGARARILVNARDLRGNLSENAALRKLSAEGARIRVCDADEKFAVVDGKRGWIGSANLSAAFQEPDQLDWGMRTNDRSIVEHLTAQFDQRWNSARAFSSVAASTEARSVPSTSATFTAVNRT